MLPGVSKLGSATVVFSLALAWAGLTELQYLAFLLSVCFGEVGRIILLFPGFPITLSRRLRHGHRMYVKLPFLPLLSRHAYLN